MDSDERLHRFLENAPLGVVTCDRSGNVTAINQKMLDLLGAPSDDFARSTNLLSFPLMVMTGISGDIAACLSRGESLSNECHYTSHWGKSAYLRYNMSPLTDDAGEVSGILAFIEDVTWRREAEEGLKASETFLNNVFESIQDGISVLDKDLNIVRTNRVMEEWYPHMVPLERKKCYYAYHGRSEPCDICPSMKAIRQKSMQCEIVPFHGENGVDKGWLEIYSFPILDAGGNVTGVIEHVRDITKRKLSEEALMESEEKFRALTETASAAICILQDGRFQYINPAMEAISGYTIEELRSMDPMDLVHPDMVDYFKGTYSRWLKCPDKEFRYEFKGIDRHGGIKWLDVSRKTIDYNGRPALLLTGIDITDRKRAESEQREAKEQAELYVDLMGHDINNMHQMALGYLEIAFDAEADDSKKALLGKPIEALQRSSRIIRNVRKLQRLREGSMNAQTIDLCAMLSDLGREYEALPGSTVTVNLNGHQGCYVRANELLYDVFENLTGNAIKHSDGHARVSVGLDSMMEAGRRCYAISVEDNGPGIPDDYKTKIFQRLLKGTTGAKGSGIGLYLVKSLIDSFQGRVWVEDRVPGDHSQGARFVVVLPAAEQPDR